MQWGQGGPKAIRALAPRSPRGEHTWGWGGEGLPDPRGAVSPLHILGSIYLPCSGKKRIDLPSHDWFLSVHTSPGSEGQAFSKLG